MRKVRGTYGTDYEPGEFVRREILERLALTSELYPHQPADLRPDHWVIGLLLENFGAYSSLRLLGENRDNHDLDVVWDWTPLVESGWATEEEFTAGPAPQQRFLIVTEGSSDARILRRALGLFRPHIADFFQFVDMEEGHPFSVWEPTICWSRRHQRAEQACDSGKRRYGRYSTHRTSAQLPRT